ncbi:MAG: LPS export ABC transporter periplasmic protein LptC [Alphaproteobacteria bacterium]|nr:LPS export ABC transporter periplasmic protein LptC [Alphaproteobacteria bacterium]
MAGRKSNGAVAEPMGSVPPQRQQRDWATRARGSIDEAKRYTRFVVIMKRALLIAAGGVILAVIAYSVQTRDQDKVAMTFDTLASLKDDLTMVKPKLTGTTSDGDAFVVTADTLRQLARGARRAALVNVQADIALKKQNGWISVTASTGTLDAESKTATLRDNIAAYSDQGYEIHTDLMNMDLGKGVLVGPHPVTGHGPLGTLSADRFEITRDTKQIKLSGNVHMTIYAGALKKSKSGVRKK